MLGEPLDIWKSARSGNRRGLARALSIVEDGRDGASDILAAAHRLAGDAHLVGITGAPGAGKSTLTDRLVTHARADHDRVAVVAVDPSSPFTGGAILGDRIRMQDHTSDEGVFVRSMSSRGHLGGLADATAKLVCLLDATEHDPVFVETVGVGQSEVEVMDLVDTVVVVVTPGMGDGVQAAKAGLLETADVLTVNKGDMPGASQVVTELTNMLELGPPRAWTPPVIVTTASTGEGVAELARAIDDHRRHLVDSGRLSEERRTRTEIVVRRAVLSRLSRHLVETGIDPLVIDRVVSREVDPWSAADSM
ncbi:MAG: methylmalonyl Co-A mutase-associated GTPase MeaB [Acidimicrobiia bacterium]|nr:methylmalonyl Co-A mutase-associated GTPase MeaB [Acidimicrobiia bacterium]MDH4308963.1 methylmalonyl Co-A mutase-associated GTPase MeaB [Acidimicrobiia bacterium]